MDIVARFLAVVMMAAREEGHRASFCTVPSLSFLAVKFTCLAMLPPSTQTISSFQSRHLHEFKVVYVSVDVDEAWYKAGIQGKVSGQQNRWRSPESAY